MASVAAPDVAASNQRWKTIEQKAAAKRIEKCNKTLEKLLGSGANRLPRVGMAFSGGGWRAMASAVSLMDALSIPLDPSETAAAEEGIKLMDTITHIFGLSGGSWAAFVSLAGGDRNPFHHSPTDGSPITDADRARHPWLHGQQNRFDPAVHTHEGLKFMTDAAHASKACYRGGKATRLVSLSANVADVTFGSALSTRLLGATLVERWSNFLANDILAFKDNGELKAPSKEAEQQSSAAGGAATAALSGSVGEKGLTAAEVSAAVSDAKAVAKKDPNIGSKARSVKLSDLRALVERGDFPFVCNTAIADRPHMTQSADFSNTTRLYDWVEISPFFIRNAVNGNFTDDVDGSGAYFDVPVTAISAAAGEGTATTPDRSTNEPLEASAAAAAPPRTRHDMFLHNYMAVCGSAFACDVGALLPKGVADTIRDNVRLKPSPIVGGGLTEIIYGRGGGGEQQRTCVCRDAGIDFNVPFPPMLSEAGREFDIIIAMDAGMDSYNAYELQRAVELGYLVLAAPTPTAPGPLEPFPANNRVRVYHSTNGGPTIIYFLALTTRPTSKVIHKPDQITRDAAKVRQAVMEELMPLLLSELRLFYSNEATSAGALDGALTNTPPTTVGTSLTRRVRYNPTSSRNDDLASGASLAADGNSASPAVSGSGQTPFSPSAGGPNSSVASSSTTSGTAGAFTNVAEAIIGAAAARGLFNETIDAFFIVEKAVLAGVPGKDRRLRIIEALEAEAMAIAAGTPHPAPLKDRLTEKGGADIVESLARVGVIDKIGWGGDVMLRTVALRTQWVDFFVATTVVRHMLPNSGIDPALIANALKAMGRDGLETTTTQSEVEEIAVQSRAIKTTSRLSTLMGSLASKLSKQRCEMLSSPASAMIARRYLSQVETAAAEASKLWPIGAAPSTNNPTAAPDSLELNIAHFCDNLVDFYASMLSFDHLNEEMSLSRWDLHVLSSFAVTTRRIFDALTIATHRSDLIRPAAHAVLIAEAIARHPSEHSFFLLRTMCEQKGAYGGAPQDMMTHMGAPSSMGDNDGVLLALSRDPSLRAHPEDLLRVVAAAFDAPEAFVAKREAVQALLASMPRGGSATSPVVTLTVAHANCFANAVRILQRGAPLDDSAAVEAILGSTTHYATVGGRMNKQKALFMVWSEGAKSQEFLFHIATRCLATLQLFDFMAPYAPTVTIPSGTAPDRIESALAFAEKHKQYVKKVVASDPLLVGWSADQKERLERFNSALLSTAHEVKGAVIGKVGDVAGALKGGLKGLWGKK